MADDRMADDRRAGGAGPLRESAHWPVELRLRAGGHALAVTFEDGATFELEAEYLRVTSPSAEVQGHSLSERKTVGGKIKVAIIGVAEVGNYAVRLTFDDIHDTGIYGWDYLYELGRDRDRIWGGYVDDLAAKGLSRERPGQK